MKKHAAFLCFLLMGVLLAMPAQAKVTNAMKVLAKEGNDAFWALVNRTYGNEWFYPADTADLSIYSPDGVILAVQESDAYHPQTTYRVMMQETAGTGFTIEQVDVYYPTPWGEIIQSNESEHVLASGPVYIPPYGSFSYGSGCPATGNLRYEIVAVSGTDDNGHELEFFGVFERLNYLPSSNEVRDPAHDTDNLRYQADYAVEVARDVWWVPAVSLGRTQYTNQQIAAMVTKTPEEKQAAVSTLYEALQLFQISNFANADDNVRIRENNIDWEHHKPGYDAVRTNAGCCATDSNWLNYILRDDYEEVGFLAYSQKDGSGHIINYLFHDGFYYFIDLTHYRTDFLNASAPETGSMADYRNSDFVSGNIHKAASPEAYVQYCVDSFNDPPARFFLYQAADCMPVDGRIINGKMTILYPTGTDIRVLDGRDADALDVQFVNPPRKTYKWSSVKSAVFQADARYLTDAADSAAPLTEYREGDFLSLEDYGENGFATIDGVDYSVCKTQECWFSFEGNFSLYGGNAYSYVAQELPPLSTLPALENMDSAVLGDLVVSILKKNASAQIILCEEESGGLRVTKVMDGAHYFCMPVNMYRNDQQQWQLPPTYWFLMIFENEYGMQHEFGRFGCR